MQVRVAKLRGEHDRLAEEQRPKWLAAIEREWNKIDKAQRRRTQELAAGFVRQQDLRAAWQYVDAIEHDESAERVLRKALAPAMNPAVDLTEVLATLEAGSAEIVIERVSRQRAEQVEREEAERLAHQEALEEARRTFEAESLGAASPRV